MKKNLKYGWYGINEQWNGRWRAVLPVPQPGGKVKQISLGVHDRRIEAARAVYEAAKVHRPELELPYPEEEAR